MIRVEDGSPIRLERISATKGERLDANLNSSSTATKSRMDGLELGYSCFIHPSPQKLCPCPGKENFDPQRQKWLSHWQMKYLGPPKKIL